MITYSQVPVMCHGILLKRDDDDIESNTYHVNVETTNGFIDTIAAKLSYSPGTKSGFVEKAHVAVMVVFQWSIEENRITDVVQGANHMIMGLSDLERTDSIDIPNPNIKYAGGFTSYINPVSNSGLIIGDDGSIKISTNGKTVRELFPRGDEMYENLDRGSAQNFMRVITNGDYKSREYFGVSMDKSGLVSKSTIPVMYKRFVTKTLEDDIWVSSNEGTYQPWVGSNNNFNKVPSTSSKIIYNKIINYKKDRLTIHAGEEGSGFYTFRIDRVNTVETTTNIGSGARPVSATQAFYLGISETGEIKMEAGISNGKPAMKFGVSKNGEVSLDFGKSFKLNGKEVVTSDFIGFMAKHQSDLTQTTSPGAPAPMSVPAIADFNKGKAPGNFMSDTSTNSNSLDAPKLRST